MATLVLTAVGSAVGGPIGGAIGAAIGQQADMLLFAPKSREGPRLKDLAVQTSSYGSDIPAVFGAMRFAGTVIWATDLIERRSKSGGGKGRPSTVNYSYSVSMAVALSSRPLARIGRIWADGNLLRGAAGDLKVDTQLRFHTGHADQAPDPLIVAAEGPGRCPAYRGIAYVMFEDLQLADYGNRIPSLTFEIFERAGDVPVADIFAAASNGAIGGTSYQTVGGYALSGGDARAGLSSLLAALPVSIAAGTEGMRVADDWSGASQPCKIAPVREDGGSRFDAPRQSIAPAASSPASLTLRHYEPARDYQTGVQRADRNEGGRGTAQIELPAAVSAVSAKALAETGLAKTQHARWQFACQTATGERVLKPGDWIAHDGRKYRVSQIEHYRGSGAITAERVPENPLDTIAGASAGRSVPSPDFLPGETRLAAIDLPLFDTADPGYAQVAVFAWGTMSGWRRAALSVRNGDMLADIGLAAEPAVGGTALSALPPHPADLLDEDNHLDVQLAHEAMEIAARSGSPLSNDAPYCWLAGEFIRFGSVEALGQGRYRLSRLLRGCFGGGDATLEHEAGDMFVLLQPKSARLIDAVHLADGQMVEVEAMGLGDNIPAEAAALVSERAITPPAPVHGRGELTEDGALDLRWVRRARTDGGWRDGVDQLLGEDSEQYLVIAEAGGQDLRSWQTASPFLRISAEEIAALSPASSRFKVRQIGRHRISAPLFIDR